MRTHLQLGTPANTGAAFLAMAFLDDGETLAAASEDGTLTLWADMWRSGDELRGEVCSFVGRGLSRAEWPQFAGRIPYRESCR